MMTRTPRANGVTAPLFREGVPREYMPKRRPPRWRELTDEERWKRIYAAREKRAGQVIRSVQEAVALALPPYALLMALESYETRARGSIREDVYRSIVGSVALVASRLIPSERDGLSDHLERTYALMKTSGFFTDDREFIYAVAVCILKLADELRYPADSPVVAASIMLKEDADNGDNGGAWGLIPSHAARVCARMFDTLIETGLYGKQGG